MEPNPNGTEDIFPLLGTDGESVPWTPDDILTADDRHGSGAAWKIVPFVVQAGSVIWMVEADDQGWTLAELQFHPRYGFYQETRRATYTWPREAFGALLSRLASIDIAEDEISALTIEFGEWLGSRFSSAGECSQVPC